MGTLSLEERARKTDDKIRTQILFNDRKKWDFGADILEALNEAVKEKEVELETANKRIAELEAR